MLRVGPRVKKVKTPDSKDVKHNYNWKTMAQIVVFNSQNNNLKSMISNIKTDNKDVFKAKSLIDDKNHYSQPEYPEPMSSVIL